MQFAEVLDYFLSDAGNEHWPKIQKLAREDSSKADDKIADYFMEAHRLSSERICKRSVKSGKDSVQIGDHNLKPKQEVLLRLVSRPPFLFSRYH